MSGASHVGDTFKWAGEVKGWVGVKGMGHRSVVPASCDMGGISHVGGVHHVGGASHVGGANPHVSRAVQVHHEGLVHAGRGGHHHGRVAHGGGAWLPGDVRPDGLDGAVPASRHLDGALPGELGRDLLDDGGGDGVGVVGGGVGGLLEFSGS